MKKQTAVEWFNQQLVDRQNGNGDSRSRDEILEQANKMFEGQIIDAYHINPLETKYGNIGKQYFNKTYKQQKP